MPPSSPPIDLFHGHLTHMRLETGHGGLAVHETDSVPALLTGLGLCLCGI